MENKLSQGPTVTIGELVEFLREFRDDLRVDLVDESWVSIGNSVSLDMFRYDPVGNRLCMKVPHWEYVN